MTASEERAMTIGGVMGILIGAIMGVGLFSCYEHHHEIVKRGAGYYHSETGIFTWNTKAEGEKCE